MSLHRSLLSVLPLVASVVVFAGCSIKADGPDADDEDLYVDEAEAALHGGAGRAVLGLRFTGLEPLGPDFVYEGWLMVDGAPITAGRFDLTTPDETLYFSGPRAAFRSATAYILTIEPKFGDDPAPSKVHVLAGDMRAGGSGRRFAPLRVSHPAALGTDFASAEGGYILETPTTASTKDYRRGVWFLDPAAGPGPSLSLPTLPEGWVYEGWVVKGGRPISTGRFKNVTGADSDGAGMTAGPLAAPPFPGQDFITPPISLVGGKIVISVEPEDDDSPAPSAIKPLIDDVNSVGAGNIQSLQNQSETNNPRGIAVVF